MSLRFGSQSAHDEAGVERQGNPSCRSIGAQSSKNVHDALASALELLFNLQICRRSRCLDSEGLPGFANWLLGFNLLCIIAGFSIALFTCCFTI